MGAAISFFLSTNFFFPSITLMVTSPGVKDYVSGLLLSEYLTAYSTLLQEKR